MNRFFFCRGMLGMHRQIAITTDISFAKCAFERCYGCFLVQGIVSVLNSFRKLYGSRLPSDKRHVSSFMFVKSTVTQNLQFFKTRTSGYSGLPREHKKNTKELATSSSPPSSLT